MNSTKPHQAAKQPPFHKAPETNEITHPDGTFGLSFSCIDHHTSNYKQITSKLKSGLQEILEQSVVGRQPLLSKCL